MPPNGPTRPGDPDLAQAFQEVAKGEQTASAMEAQLTLLEQKIDDLLASVDLPAEINSTSTSTSTSTPESKTTGR